MRAVLFAALLAGPVAHAVADEPVAASTAEIANSSGVNSYFDLSNDGRWLIFSSFEGLVLLDLKTGKMKNVEQGWAPLSGSISPRDSTLVMPIRREGRIAIALWAPGAAQPRELLVLPRDLYLHQVQWAPDGSKVYVVIHQHLPYYKSDARDDDPSNVSVNVFLAASGVYETRRERPRFAREYPEAHAEVSRSLILSIDIATGALGLLARGNDIDRLYPSPDGRHLAVVQTKRIASPGKKDDAWSRISAGDVYLVDATATSLPGIDLEALEDRRAGWSDHAGRRLRPVLENIRTLPASEGLPRGTSLNPTIVWSPGGGAFAYATIGPTADGDVFLFDLKSRQLRNLTAGVRLDPSDKRFEFGSDLVRFYESPKFGGVFNPLWLPDGKGLVVLGKGDVWHIPVSGDASPRNLTRGFERETLRILPAVGNEMAACDSTARLTVITRDKVTRTDSVWKLDLEGKTSLVADVGVWTNFTIRTNGSQEQLFYTGQTQFSSINLYRLKLENHSTAEDLTGLSLELAGRRYPPNQVLAWKTPSGRHGYGLLYMPEGTTARKRAPLIVKGFPGNLNSQLDERASIGAFFFQDGLNDLLRMGIAVLYADIPMSPEGVYEQPMRQMVDGVNAATDAALGTGLIDPARIGLEGVQFSANMVNAVITQTNRFKAAATAAGVSNWYGDYLGDRSKDPRYYESGAGRFATPLWDDPQRYVENSPITYWNRVQTPLLITYGAYSFKTRDASMEGFRGLQYLNRNAIFANYIRMGEVPDPEAVRRIQGWFREHLLGGKAITMIADQGSFMFGAGEDAEPGVGQVP